MILPDLTPETGGPNQAAGGAARRTQEKLPLLDVARGLAILGVFIFHCLGEAFGHAEINVWRDGFRVVPAEPASLKWLFPSVLGAMGVPLFFVISGFCIHLGFARRPEQGFKEFLWRRFFRIYPPYLLWLVIFAFAFPGSRFQELRAWDWLQFISHALMLHNLHAWTNMGIVGSFWSVAVEFQLYLLYPLVYLAAKRWGFSKCLLGTFAIEMAVVFMSQVWKPMVHGTPLNLGGLPLATLFSWTLGCFVADAYLNSKPCFLRRLPLPLLILAAVGAKFVSFLSVLDFTLTALMSACLVDRFIANSRSDWMEGSRVCRVFASMGVCSYSIYLIHQPFQVFLVKLASGPAGMTAHGGVKVFFWTLLTLAPIYLIARLSHGLIELPSIKLNLLLRKKSPARA